MKQYHNVNYYQENIKENKSDFAPKNLCAKLFLNRLKYLVIVLVTHTHTNKCFLLSQNKMVLLAHPIVPDSNVETLRLRWCQTEVAESQ